ncbi:tbc-6 [Acrasis kona]|uniref:Tbc-6 n=1 Tax=Acrasis kona TaxID=1008807 RepID=A0AAW2YI86_9EUKA
MIRTTGFWEKEKKAPLLNLENNFMQKDVEAVVARAKTWPSLIDGLESVAQDQYKEQLEQQTEIDRIFIHDAERTFSDDGNRKKLMTILSYLTKEFGDYHQGLSYVTSFLLLTLDEATVINILKNLNASEKYTKGYWKSQSVKSATDGYVFEDLMKVHVPEVYAHLKKHFIQPDTYCQKWFVSLCVHVLPFEALFNFYEKYLKEGNVFLYRFALSLVKNMKSEILGTNDVSTLYAYLRLDAKYVSEQKALDIVKSADDFDLTGLDVEKARQDAFDTHLKARLEEAARRQTELANESEDEITDYSTSDDEDEDDIVKKVDGLKI